MAPAVQSLLEIQSRVCQAKRIMAMRKIMNEPVSRRPKLASTSSRPVMRFSLGVRCAALCAGLMLSGFSVNVFAKSACPGIHVEILNIENSTGTVSCALFKSPEGFPTEFLHSATNIMMLTVRDTKARCNFLDVPPGTYALAVIHDENKNGELDANFLGVPTEGYGFSSGATASMSAPSFEAASFPYRGQNLELTIRLNY